VTSVADLERERQDRERAEYRRLQERAAAVAYERKHGRPAGDLGELERAFKSGTVQTVDPCRYLSPAEIAAALAPMATG
jgi:hypothetical protein